MLHRLIFTIVFFSGLTEGAEFSWESVHKEAFEATRQRDYQQAAGLLIVPLWEQRGDDIRRAAAAQDLGTILHFSGDDRQARAWLERSLEGWRAIPAYSERQPEAMQQLGVVCHRLGDYAAAERHLREALAQRQATPVTRMNTLNTLADLLREQGRVAEARGLLRDAIVQLDAPWQAQIESLMGIASLEREEGSIQESLARWTDALAMARSRQSTLFEAICLRGLGEAWLEERNVARALPLLRRSVYLLQSARAPDLSGNDVFQVANSQRALAEAYLLDGQAAQAEEAVRRGLAALEKASAATHPQAAALFDTLAEAQARQVKLGPALESLARAEAIIVAEFGATSTMAITTAAKRGVLGERAGQPEAAVRHLEESLRQMDRGGDDIARTRLRLMSYYAAALESTHRKREARAVRAEIKVRSVE